MTKSAKPFLKNVATIEDKGTGEFYVAFRVRTADGMKKTVELPRSDLSNLQQVGGKLLKVGAVLPPRGNRRAEFVAAAVDSDSLRNLKRAAQSGWVEGYQNFVVQTKVIGMGAGGLLGIRPAVRPDERGWLHTSGTSIKWKASVGKLAQTSSHFMLCISAAFAAPLLVRCREQSFSICLSGYTRTGKSFATLLGASVTGLGQARQMLTWNTSDAAINEQLPRFNDCLAPIDDFEAMPGTDSHKYERVRNFAYGIAAGSEMLRHSSFGSPSRQWTTIMVTSMEKTIQELSKAARDIRKPGESVRMLDVPLLSADGTHIFDRAEAGGTEVTPTWKSHTFKAIIDACEQNHGAVFEEYIGRLCVEPKATRKRALKFCADFVAKVIESEDGDMARDVARKFGLIYAGGRLAIRYGLVPWKRVDLFDAICACYRAARDLLPDEGVVIRQGKALVYERLASLKRKSDVSRYSSEPGYKIIKKKTCRYLIKVDSFNALFSSRAQRQLVLASLVESKCITMKKPRGKRAKAGPQQQFTWPNGKRVRSYEIKCPRKSSKARETALYG